ncbi:hypothetical protein, partial [Aeribacillus pallidus]|uniref:hypothetical protein n=1 Tax=Aeribacillus pallidus TaxID=33936 RepID=UPI00196757FF
FDSRRDRHYNNIRTTNETLNVSFFYFMNILDKLNICGKLYKRIELDSLGEHLLKKEVLYVNSG